MSVIEHCEACGQRLGADNPQDQRALINAAWAGVKSGQLAACRQQLQGAVKALEVARSTMRRSMASDESCDLPFNEDMADALKLIDAALGGSRPVAEYVCPNGHPVEYVVMLPCEADGCMAHVAYEPTAHGMALDRQLQEAVEQIAELERLLHQANIEREDWKRWCLDHEAGGSPDGRPVHARGAREPRPRGQPA
jgi:hypothetical protein